MKHAYLIYMNYKCNEGKFTPVLSDIFLDEEKAEKYIKHFNERFKEYTYWIEKKVINEFEY